MRTKIRILKGKVWEGWREGENCGEPDKNWSTADAGLFIWELLRMQNTGIKVRWIHQGFFVYYPSNCWNVTFQFTALQRPRRIVLESLVNSMTLNWKGIHIALYKCRQTYITEKYSVLGLERDFPLNGIITIVNHFHRLSLHVHKLYTIVTIHYIWW